MFLKFYLFIIFATLFLDAHALQRNSLEIVVVIPSYNNQQWYRGNLDSVLKQDYPYFKVIYINDCSTDNTQFLVESYIKEASLKNKIKLINNTTRKGALKNLYDTIHTCSDDKVIVTVDGDDMLSSPKVLEKIAQEYSNSNIWLTYGQYVTYPEKHLGYCEDFPEDICKVNAFRSCSWRSSHLRTFYAGLFKHIKKEDLLYKDQFFPMAWDLAFMFPMLEMSSKGHFKCIKDVLYVYNQSNILNDFKVDNKQQLFLEQIIRAKTPYQPLEELPFLKQK
ncbi:glycosyltransferase family 2 protein [Candidatus Dependentiae bacterium]|nr:glycosyltransferase family 2 protein [Candidatus Dependentiae bacterium]